MPTPCAPLTTNTYGAFDAADVDTTRAGAENSSAKVRMPLELLSRRRTVSHDKALYQLRNGRAVECCIRQIKAWHALVTRFDKSPEIYVAGLLMRGAIMWLKFLP
jgi:hypothetical protein